ncbi:hypothetical protein K474DRAFT_1632694 [Panus rudis PR-1116 ss-1]|nr:hypothetical protein K474DRAFT_1632694 [Panus rudis PR-1116 ss-1]
MEEGEIYQYCAPDTRERYPELDGSDHWQTPVSSDEHPQTHTSLTSYSSKPPSVVKESGSLRLRVLQSAILHRKQSLAVLDGYTEIQIGRDIAPPGSDIPRIRLKEMEVSKVHATIYWDKERREWSVVDMGSKHGTFVRSNQGTFVPPSVPTASSSNTSPSGTHPPRLDERGFRLSAPRVASRPSRLRHGDQLSVGSTTFVVHIHPDGMPCIECSPQGGDEIELFDNRRKELERGAALRHKRALEAVSPATGHAQSVSEQDAKRSMTMLKRSLLSRHSPSGSQTPTESGQYVDRSALRRVRHPEAPPVSLPRQVLPPVTLASAPSSRYSTPSTPEPVSAPPTPVPSSNIGHRLLMKQGWQPGTALGTGEDPEKTATSLVEPLKVAGNTNRLGLGSSQPPASTLRESSAGLSWKEEAKRRRWAATNANSQTSSRLDG